MNIAIIGGGFTGLTAAYKLSKAGHAVTVFEKNNVLGGLAHGFKRPGWEWYLEYAYHHLFANDWAILGLIKELGLSDKLILTRPITANYYQKSVVQLDSPVHLLSFPFLSPIDKLRTAALLAFCKVNPFWQPLEGITAKYLFEVVGGKAAWEKLWEPLMVGKFGDLANTVAASWLWARIKKRTPKLYYIEGGFHTLIAALAKAIKDNGGKIYTNTSVTPIKSESGIRNQESWKNKTHNSQFIIHNSQFDRVLLTVPTPIAAKLLSSSGLTVLPSPPIPHLHAQTLILETKEPILRDVYWLNITDRSFPFLAVVAHTNMINPSAYGGHHLTYFGNYLPTGHPYLSMTKDQLFKVFLPYIKRLIPSFHLSFGIYHLALFNGPYAQPVHQLHYSNIAPRLETSIKGVYLANLESIYPWDRGTNYAVELGTRAARTIIQ